MRLLGWPLTILLITSARWAWGLMPTKLAEAIRMRCRARMGLRDSSTTAASRSIPT
jgi:hypothetical protein